MRNAARYHPKPTASKAPEAKPIQLTEAQSSIFSSRARYRCVCAGRRFGKSHVAITYLLRKACDPEVQDLMLFYVAPTYRQAKAIAWRLLKALIPPGWEKKTDETDLSITLHNGCTIALRGADNPDSLRGIGLDAVVMDEFQDIELEAWTEVISPALADRQGSALFLFTPKGFNHAYDLWNAAHALPDWEAFTFTTEQGGRVPPEELEAQRRNLDERTYRQEFMASFECMGGLVYQNWERAHNCREDLVDNGGPLLVGIDFNVSPMSGVIGTRAGDQLHIFDEIQINNGNTQLLADEIKRRYPKRRIQCYPDPSGRARKTSAAVGETDFSLLKAAGFQVIAPNKAPMVVDRINEVNALLKNAEGVRRLFVHPRCKDLIKCLEGLTYKEGTSIPDKNLGLDHKIDALGYLTHSEFPLIQKVARFHAINF